MGLKSLISLQMIPWCVPLIWNHISCIHVREAEQQQPQQHGGGGGGGGASTPTIKVIKSDGIVKIYHKPINASDLMTEFPKHLICHSDSFYIGQKIQALSGKDKLQLGQKYFLLPQHLFQSVLSFVTIASFATASKSSSQVSPLTSSTPSSISSTNSMPTAKVRKNADLLNKVRSCQPFDIRKTASGSLQIRVSDEFISKLMESPTSVKEEEDEDVDENRVKQRICNTPQLQKDYSQLVGCCKQWKPKLETIAESSTSSSPSKVRKLGSFSIIHRKNNKKSHQDHHSQTQTIQRSISSPEYYHYGTSNHHQPDLTSKTNVKIIKMSKQSINNRMICKF